MPDANATPISSAPLVVNYGGGVNSTALLVGMRERGERPDMIVFADTGGERPETYAYLDVMDSWLLRAGFPPIERVRWIRKDGTFLSLEDWCLKHGQLPSLAYGMKGCSVKWKAQPVDKHVKMRYPNGAVRCLGYDALESHRVNRGTDGGLWAWRYPLVEWNWTRRECGEAIERAGLPVSAKSACFFCPASKPHEVVNLRREHPALADRALEIEDAGAAYSAVSVGLGRSWRWRDVLDSDAAQVDMFRSPPDSPCGCYDG